MRSFMITSYFTEYYYSIQIKEDGIRNAYEILIGKPEGKIPLERLKRRWRDNIRIDLGDAEVWIGCMWLRIDRNGGLW
jgi:hypothetical protein